MAFISVAISLSLTKIYSDKHGYEVDANQVSELSEFLGNFCRCLQLMQPPVGSEKFENTCLTESCAKNATYMMDRRYISS